MRRIFKYPVKVTDEFTLKLPAGAAILTVQTQGTMGEPFIWAEVDPDAPEVPVTFRLIGTGHPIEDHADLQYIGTFQMDDGHLVFHLFKKVVTRSGPTQD